MFGEPIELAWTSTTRHPRLATGWIFPCMMASKSGPGVEFLCVPQVEAGDERCRA